MVIPFLVKIKFLCTIPVLFFFIFFNIYQQKMFHIKNCWWLDSNCRPLVSEVTALPTEPHPLPSLIRVGEWITQPGFTKVHLTSVNSQKKFEASNFFIIGFKRKKFRRKINCFTILAFLEFNCQLQNAEVRFHEHWWSLFKPIERPESSLPLICIKQVLFVDLIYKTFTILSR